MLRNAIDMFQGDHNGTYPAAATISTLLTQYSDINSNTSATKTTACIYGPYLRSVPALPVGAASGSTGISTTAGTGVGWIYNATAGTIITNTTATEVDSNGVAYNTY